MTPRRLIRQWLIAFALAPLLLAPGNAFGQTAGPDTFVSGIDTAHIDRSVPPQDNFYQHVNGDWLKQVTIPSDQALWGTYFDLQEQTQKDVRSVIQAASRAQPERGTPRQQVGDLYASFVDTTRRERLGLTPLRDDLRRIESADTRTDLVRLMAWFQRRPAEAPLQVDLGPDAKHPDRYAASLDQDGLGLPQPDYYQKDQFSDRRTAYRDHITEIFRLADVSNPNAAAQRAFALEQQLASIQLSYEEARDARASYNPHSWSDLGKKAPALDWNAFAEAAGLTAVDTVIVGQPDYVADLGILMRETSLQTWRDYFRWQLLKGFSSHLSPPFAQAHFEFFQGRLRGAEARPPLWKRAVTTVNTSLGGLVGRLYVETHFSAEKKQTIERIVENLRTAFHKEIETLDWMSDSTKTAAHRKLREMTAHVAYPDEWQDFSGLRIEPDDLVGNMRRAARFDYERQIGRLGEPVNQKLWTRAIPQEVNGYIDNRRNLITVTAGILQPPFFQPDAAPAVNYGGIGAVIGHEISHAFDSEGRKYDHKGRLHDWWTEADEERYQARSDALVEQFNQYVPGDSVHVDGELTLPENIADLAGVAAAHRAYRLSLNTDEASVIDGLTGDQRFYMSWAQIWRTKIRPAALRQMLQRDPHSPPRYRVNGIVPHLASFHEAFGITPGNDMYRPPEERIEIW
jgi:putative endopeptidase